MRYLKRGALYAEVVQKVFKEEGLPKDLFYVGLIESGFNLHARSHANAIGPWQFIKSTAKRYGLRVESQVDERKNIHKATKAAAHYFKDLYNIFGSWELALCAYNAGEYRVIGAIRKGNSRNYLTLARKKLLPRETIHYIPKLAAAHFLSQKDPFKNHLKNPSPRAKEFSQGEFFPLKTPFSIHTLAKRMRIKSLDLKRLNPDIKKGKIFPRGRAFRLVVPKNRLDSLAFITGQPRAKKTPSFSYKVKPGDNLISIAQRAKVKVSSLKRWNKIRGDQIFIGQRLKIRRRQVKRYIVRRGDSLFGMAKRFGTSIQKIMAMNDLTKKTIYPRQEILIPH